MRDPRCDKLAYNIINYSLQMKKGEKLYIQTYGSDFNVTKALIRECYKVGTLPFLKNDNDELTRMLIENCNDEQMEIIYLNDLELMKHMDAYVAVYAYDNSNEFAGVSDVKMDIYNKHSNEVRKYRCYNLRWCILCGPTYSLAQSSNMNTEKFEDFFFKVCNLDYSKMSRAMDNLVEIMDKADKVRICGNGSDITFSIKGIGSVKCAGEANIPDGEVYTAPIKESVNGYIQYNVPSIYNGITFENVRLEFKDGKIVKATANDTEAINKIFDTDAGARYIGEFALGVNPYINKPMKDILFDEKIAGSIHFTPGACYEDISSNGNESAIHWDLVLIQTLEYGGGEIYFDDILIRKDGLFVIKELKCLNPDNLK